MVPVESHDATIADGTGVATILNDDSSGGPLTVTFQIADGADDAQPGRYVARRRRRPDVGRHRIVGGLELRRAPLHRRDASAQRHHHLGPTRGQRRQYRWITLGFEFGIEAAASSAAFSAASLPSARTLLAPRVLHSSNQQWTANSWIVLDDLSTVLQALVNRADWNPGNALGLIVRGTAGAWSRKPINSFETTATMAPRLVVSYTGTVADSTGPARRRLRPPHLPSHRRAGAAAAALQSGLVHLEVAMTRYAFAALLVFGLAATTDARQGPTPPATLEAAVVRSWKSVHDKILAMAKDTQYPENKLQWKPHPDSRTVMQELRHVTIGLRMTSALARGEKFDFEAQEKADEQKPKTRASVVSEMEAAIAESYPLVEKSQAPRLVGWLEHQGEHYGKMVTAYRVNGIVPPISRK